MAQLIVRNVEEKLVRTLRLRAARNGRSAEGEHREILKAALIPGHAGGGLKELLLAMPPFGEDDDFSRASDLGRKVSL